MIALYQPTFIEKLRDLNPTSSVLRAFVTLYEYVATMKIPSSYKPPQTNREWRDYLCSIPREWIIPFVNQHQLRPEQVDTESKREWDVWRAMLDRLSVAACMSQVPEMARYGHLNDDAHIQDVIDVMTDDSRVVKEKVNPLHIAVAMAKYWAPNRIWETHVRIENAYEHAFETATKNFKTTGKNICIGVDPSFSMEAQPLIPGTVLTPLLTSAVLAECFTQPGNGVAFGSLIKNQYRSMKVSWLGMESLYQLLRKQRTFDVDHAAHIKSAEKQMVPVDVFIIITDSCYSRGDMHPLKALEAYNKTMNRKAKLVLIELKPEQYEKYEAVATNRSSFLKIKGFHSRLLDDVRTFIMTPALRLGLKHKRSSAARQAVAA